MHFFQRIVPIWLSKLSWFLVFWVVIYPWSELDTVRWRCLSFTLSQPWMKVIHVFLDFIKDICCYSLL